MNNFTGPYSVSKQLFLDLHRAGFLRISNIQINECLYDFPDETFECLVNMKAVHTPSTSSLIKISNLEVSEYAVTFQKHLTTLLSINAENIEFDIRKNLIFVCSSSNEPPIVNERTKKIVTMCRLEMESMNNFLYHFKNYKDFLLLCCPNLEYMEFEFTNYINFYLEEVENSSNDYLTKLEVIIVPIIEDLKLLHRGSEHLKIRIEFTAKFSIREEFEVNIEKVFCLALT
ncbi:unnamed protein product [Meloidogyne enterolobii]|uniref:Uncharacterized protein n=1 Tax=Meloidogyne enterolobii TaxID=390850 RepID=A0ACB1B508_MELEN